MSGVMLCSAGRARRRVAQVVLIAVLVGLACSQASADPGTTLTLTAAPVGGVVSQGPLAVPLDVLSDSGTITVYQPSDGQPLEIGPAMIDYSIFVNLDPVVSQNLVVTNNTATDQSFTLIIGLPLGSTPVMGPTEVGGSIDVDVRDNNADGATLSLTDGTTPLYLATADDGYSRGLLTAMPPLVTTAYGSANADDQFGTPIASAPGPGGIVNDIGLILRFDLSAQDTATFNSVFVLEGQPIPEPATFVLAACGSMALLRWRRGGHGSVM